MAKPIYAIGLMSGTSVDSVDAALLKIGGKEDQLVHHLQRAYPKKLREEILGLIRTPSAQLPQLTRIHYDIGTAFADAAQALIQDAKKKRLLKGAVSVIGSHGQTIFHDPDGPRTLQIGEASLIAARTGVTTVSDFRVADTAVGGEGAPLLPYYHRRLFAAHARKGIVVHNLGGISNYTYIGPKEKIFALDTGPANCLIDGLVQKLSGGARAYDANGAQARAGKLNGEILRSLFARPEIRAFRRRRAPKSTGRELFSPRLLDQLTGEFTNVAPADLLHSLTHFTTELIAESYESEIFDQDLPLAQVVLAGGGARNSFLLDILRARFPLVQFGTMENFGHDAQALEAQAFAYYAHLALLGEPITGPTTTGARSAVTCGKISPGANWTALTGSSRKEKK